MSDPNRNGLLIDPEVGGQSYYDTPQLLPQGEEIANEYNSSSGASCVSPGLLFLSTPSSPDAVVSQAGRVCRGGGCRGGGEPRVHPAVLTPPPTLGAGVQEG